MIDGNKVAGDFWDYTRNFIIGSEGIVYISHGNDNAIGQLTQDLT